MFKTNVYKEAFSHMLTNKMTTEDYSILNLANEAYPAMPSVDSKLDDTLAKYNPFRKVASIFNIEVKVQSLLQPQMELQQSLMKLEHCLNLVMNQKKLDSLLIK